MEITPEIVELIERHVKKCRMCEKPFIKKAGNAEYCDFCSSNRKKYHRKTNVVYFNTCSSCGKLFTTRKLIQDKCSNKCLSKFKTDHARIKKCNNNVSYGNCKECGRLFTRHMNRSNQQYCSDHRRTNKRLKEYKSNWAANQALSLDDSYVKNQIKASLKNTHKRKIDTSIIPNEIIEFERDRLKLKRTFKK